MRYSPYEMKDYGLQHGGGVVYPFPNDFKSATAESEAMWNLTWLAIPEVDSYLDVPYEDFAAFNTLLQAFPYHLTVWVRDVLKRYPAIIQALSTMEPTAFMRALSTALRQPLAHHRDPGVLLQTMWHRADTAQALIDVRDAAAVCQSVVAVDFRARRRM